MKRRVCEANLVERDRHYLYAIGPNPVAVVGDLGGWLFDRALTGWGVTAFTRNAHDTRPLEILGFRADRYENAGQHVNRCSGHRAVAVSADVYEHDDWVRGSCVVR